ncbi:aquaporin-11-like isoform X2 [Gigantopelta aegis]|nr:aquaporin-11-like isoform X2 [Gigantopelta aegis]XP_041370129.1 aquaporin-11-like isoform X2 [Gigantopelta aegis]XP_041370130.1 aquaporin-11-like isoform X2 [Gigantopelta aegis]
MDWRVIWGIMMGQDPGSEFVSPYTASLIFFFITMATGAFLRTLNTIMSPPWLQEYIADFVTTAEACAYVFEKSFVYKYYGSFWFVIVIICQLYVFTRTFGNASYNPVKAITQLVNAEITPAKAALKIVIQALAGLASYRFAKAVWALDLISDHHERYYETTCASELNVGPLVGCGIEMAASLSDTWLGMQRVSKVSLLDEFVKYTNGALMITVGLDTTGMYFNPASAFGHTFGCEGTAAWEHFVVYWIGPFLGCYAAIQLDKIIHIDVFSTEEAEVKKTQ